MKKLFPPLFFCSLLLPLVAAAQHAAGPVPTGARAYAQVLSSRPVLSRADVTEAYQKCEATGESVERCVERIELNARHYIENYEVTYRYGGRVYRTRMPYDPGQRVPVRPDVHGRSD